MSSRLAYIYFDKVNADSDVKSTVRLQNTLSNKVIDFFTSA